MSLRAYLHFFPWILLVALGVFLIRGLIQFGRLLAAADEEHRDGL